jgi:hypothetical protein
MPGKQMTIDKVELEGLLDFAVDLARGAGAITLKYLRIARPKSICDDLFPTGFPMMVCSAKRKANAKAPRDGAGSLIPSMAPSRLCMAFLSTGS